MKLLLYLFIVFQWYHNNLHFRYYHRSIAAPGQNTSEREGYVRNVVICAVILDEWLKELAAVAQEHSVLQSNVW